MAISPALHRFTFLNGTSPRRAELWSPCAMRQMNQGSCLGQKWQENLFSGREGVSESCFVVFSFFFLHIPNKGYTLSSQTLCHLYILAASHAALGSVGKVPRSKPCPGQCREVLIGVERNLQSAPGLACGGTIPLPGQ